MDKNEAQLYLGRMVAGANNYTLVLAGMNAGLFDAIHRHGENGISAEALAQELDFCEDYVRVWCQTAYAIQVLDHIGDNRFCIGEGFEDLVVTGRPGSLKAGYQLTQIFIEERLEFPEFLRTGKVCTFEDHGERLSRVIGNAARGGAVNAIDLIYKKIPDVHEKLKQGARVLEIGCGMGRLLSALAKEFPEASFVGVDIDSHGIEEGNREIEISGLTHRIRLHRVGGESIDFIEEFDIVSLNNVMHELRADIRPQAVQRMVRALRPGGLMISNDFYYPSRLEDFRVREHQGAIFDQIAEVTWGNRHLSREQLAEMFAECGFTRSEFHLIPMPNLPYPRLSAVAYR